MEHILLIEPNYQNKFPPIGLMKIASYHKLRGDSVEFYKGEAPYFMISKANRVYITSLFTFHYDITLTCIQHYLKYISKDRIYVGGIAATLFHKELKRETGISQILPGLLTDSSAIGYADRANIDCMPLDYDILDDISYNYPMNDNYFIHTTRGCPRSCVFCAVKFIEPEYITTNNIIEQVSRVDEVYGPKRNLLIMDNNILFSHKIDEIVNDILSLGFNKKASYIYPNNFSLIMNKIRRRINSNSNYSRQIDEILKFLLSFSHGIISNRNINDRFCEIISMIINSNSVWDNLQKFEGELLEIIDKFRFKRPLIRYVDFNQGIDARLLTDKKAKLLSNIAIKPFRLAYDSVKQTKIFISATTKAINNGISNFSNYILYNWKDRPEDLWLRLYTAIKLYNNFEIKVNAFSFPMKYAPINKKDRNFVGSYWNKKFLDSINIIINVTKGVVAKELLFFYEAFGKNSEEFIQILTMPDEFIRHRHFFRNNGLIECWSRIYKTLSSVENKELLSIITAAKHDRTILFKKYSPKINRMLILYKLNKSQFDRGDTSAEDIIHTLTCSSSLKRSSRG